MYKRNVMTLLTMIMLLFLIGCSGSVGSGLDPGLPPVVDQANEQDAKRQAEPRRIPDSYPLPVLDGWIAHAGKDIFQLGGDADDITFKAQFQFDGDPEAEGKRYEKVLSDLGFIIEPGQSSVTENAMSFQAFGHIMGVEYGGVLRTGTNESYGDDGVLESYIHITFREMF